MTKKNASDDKMSEGHRARLRSRFEKAGLATFSPHEVLELILTLAIPRKDVKAPAKVLLKRFGSLKGVLDADPREIAETNGIGSVTPVALKIIKEVAGAYLQQGAEDHEFLGDPKKLIDFWSIRIGGLKVETFQVAFLDASLKLMRDGIQTLEEGTIDRAAVYPRKVVASALRRGASALVLAHNHPGGNPQPSDEDKVITRSLVLAASAVQIQVVDHIIISESDSFSFRRAALL